MDAVVSSLDSIYTETWENEWASFQLILEDELLGGERPLAADNPQLVKRKGWLFGWEGAGPRHLVGSKD